MGGVLISLLFVILGLWQTNFDGRRGGDPSHKVGVEHTYEGHSIGAFKSRVVSQHNANNKITLAVEFRGLDRNSYLVVTNPRNHIGTSLGLALDALNFSSGARNLHDYFYGNGGYTCLDVPVVFYRKVKIGTKQGRFPDAEVGTIGNRNLPLDRFNRFKGRPDAANSDDDQEQRWQICGTKKAIEEAVRFAGGCYCLLFGCLLIWFYTGKFRRILGPTLIGLGLAAFLFPPYYTGDCENTSQQPQSFPKPSPHSGNTVPQQFHLTSVNYRGTVIVIGERPMANVLSADKQTAISGMLAEGSGIRSIERQTGVHRDTIMRLGVRVGQGCANLMDHKMRDLPCKQLQFDEIWGFIGKKERRVRPDDDPTLGDVWTFCAIDSDTKLVPSFKVGKRDSATANAFVSDVKARMANRVQISSDALGAYVEAIERSFGADVDFAQIVKTYTHDCSIVPEVRFSAPEVVTTEKRRVSGFPNMRLASTSHIERLNGTTRLHMRRLTRLTYAFSRKRENFEAAVALHFAYYNFVKRHNTLRCTPAMAAGVERDFWTVRDLVEAA